MAELVELYSERTINELEQLERIGLFQNDEIKAVINQRKAFEYRLQSVKKSKHTYLKYINYEQSFLSLIRLRRKKIRFYGKVTEIEFSIVNHIKSLFSAVTNKYPADVDLWFSYVEFCKKCNNVTKVSSIYYKMLQFHSKNEKLWIAAAKWEFEENNAPETARKLMQRSIRFNPTTKKLYIEYFRMELMYTDQLRKRRQLLLSSDKEGENLDENISDSVYEGKIALLVYKNAIEHITDLDFFSSFLNVASEFDFTKQHKFEIFEDIKQKFLDQPQAWDLIAKSRFDGMKETITNKNLTRTEAVTIKRIALNESIEIYENAVQVLNSEAMWEFYIKFYLNLLSKTTNERNIQALLKKLLELFEKVWKNGKLTPEMFCEWLLILNMCSDSTEDISKKIQTLISQAYRNWCYDFNVCKLCLTIASTRQDFLKLEVKQLFEKAIKRLDQFKEITTEQIIGFWSQYLEWAEKVLGRPEILHIASRAASCSGHFDNRTVAEYFKPRYLQLAAATSIDKARQVYHTYKTKPPVCKDFYIEMINIENSQKPMQISNIRKIYDEAVSQFVFVNLWLDYIKFELNHKPENVGKIYSRASKFLPSLEFDQFLEKYALLQQGLLT